MSGTVTENGSRAWCRPFTVAGGGDILQVPAGRPYDAIAYGGAVTAQIRQLLAAGMQPDEVVRFVTQRSTMLAEDVIRLVAAAIESDVSGAVFVLDASGISIGRDPTPAELADSTMSPCDPDHRPGSRDPGPKPAPPVPRWARKRRQRSAPPPPRR